MQISLLKSAIVLCRNAGITTNVHGHRGIGKSAAHAQLVKELAAIHPTKHFGFKDFRLSQCEAADLRGLPDKYYPYPDRPEFAQTIYLPPADLPMGEYTDGLSGETWGPNGCYDDSKFDEKECREAALAHEQCPEYLKDKGADTSRVGLHCGLLFLDEPNRAEDDVLQAVFQLIWDRAIGSYVVPTGWSLHCACNFADGPGYQVNNFADAAFVDRFCHLTLSFDDDYVSEWSSYMSKYGDVVARILQFVGCDRNNLVGQVDAQLGFSNQPSPRSWEGLAKVLEEVGRMREENPQGAYPQHVVLDVMAGLIGLELATQFERFTVIVTPQDIVLHGVSAEIRKKLSSKDCTRNALLGLMWGLMSIAEDIKENKEDKEKRLHVLQFMRWLAVDSDERDLATALGQSLVSGDSNTMGGASLTNPAVAKLLKKLKNKPFSWTTLLQSDKELQEIMKRVSYGDDS